MIFSADPLLGKISYRPFPSSSRDRHGDILRPFPLPG